MIDPVSSAAAAATSTGGVRPTAAVAEALGSFASDLAAAETVAARGLGGEASAREVAEAVMQAERSLQAAVAVRDKIVSSFLEISRMAI